MDADAIHGQVVRWVHEHARDDHLALLELHLATWSDRIARGRPCLADLPVRIARVLAASAPVRARDIAAATWAFWLGIDLLDNVADDELPPVWRDRYGDGAADQATLAALAFMLGAPQQILAGAGVGDEARAQLATLTAECLWTMIRGQSRDLRGSAMSAADAEAVAADKSGHHLRFHAMAGVIAAAERVPISAAQRAALSEAAVRIGTAVQLVSDVEDLFVGEASDDVRNGRATYPLVRAARILAEQDPAAAARWSELCARLRAASPPPTAMAELRQLVRASGVDVTTALRARALMREAHALLAGAGVRDPDGLKAVLSWQIPLAPTSRPDAREPVVEDVTPRFGSALYWRRHVEIAIDRLAGALARRGYDLDPALRIEADPRALYCFYEAGSRRITIGLPDLTTPIGRLHWVMYLPLVGERTIEAAAAAADALLPVLAVHETMHHLRDHRGRMDLEDPWSEEHAVNILTIAYLRTLPDWSSRLPGVVDLLTRMKSHAARLRVCEYLEATHDDLDEILLHDMRALDDASYHRAFDLAAARAQPVLEIMLAEGMVTADQIDEARRRQEAARPRFNHDYGRDFAVTVLLAISHLRVEMVDRDLPDLDRALLDLVGPPAR